MLDITLWMDIFTARRQGGEKARVVKKKILPRRACTLCRWLMPHPHYLCCREEVRWCSQTPAPTQRSWATSKNYCPQARHRISILRSLFLRRIADYGGYQYVLAHYTIGAFIYNGRADAAYSTEWTQLMNAIAVKHIPLITLGAGDRVRFGGAGLGAPAENEIDILSPDAASAHSPNASDTAITQRKSSRRTPAFLCCIISKDDASY